MPYSLYNPNQDMQQANVVDEGLRQDRNRQVIRNADIYARQADLGNQRTERTMAVEEKYNLPELRGASEAEDIGLRSNQRNRNEEAAVMEAKAAKQQQFYEGMEKASAMAQRISSEEDWMDGGQDFMASVAPNVDWSNMSYEQAKPYLEKRQRWFADITETNRKMAWLDSDAAQSQLTADERQEIRAYYEEQNRAAIMKQKMENEGSLAKLEKIYSEVDSNKALATKRYADAAAAEADAIDSGVSDDTILLATDYVKSDPRFEDLPDDVKKAVGSRVAVTVKKLQSETPNAPVESLMEIAMEEHAVRVEEGKDKFWGGNEPSSYNADKPMDSEDPLGLIRSSSR